MNKYFQIFSFSLSLPYFQYELVPLKGEDNMVLKYETMEEAEQVLAIMADVANPSALDLHKLTILPVYESLNHKTSNQK